MRRADAVEAGQVGLEPRDDAVAERVREAADGDDLICLDVLRCRVLGHLSVLHLLHGKLRLAEVAAPRAKRVQHRVRGLLFDGFLVRVQLDVVARADLGDEPFGIGLLVVMKSAAPLVVQLRLVRRIAVDEVDAGQERAFELARGLVEDSRVDACARFDVLQVVNLQLTQEREREERARAVLVETRKGQRVDDGIAASRVLDKVPDYNLLSVAVIHLGAAFRSELEAGGRLVNPDTGRMLVALVLLIHRRRASRQQREMPARTPSS